MAVSFQEVTLDTVADREGRLVFRDGRLLAVLSCLSEIHDHLSGHWFIETVFGDVPTPQPPVFESIDQFEGWLAKAK